QVCTVGSICCGGQCVDTTSDPNNYSGCGLACPVQNDVPSCQNGICGIGSCLSGYGDCNASASDGCETNLLGNDINNCAVCGKVCSSDHVLNAACSGGLCTGTCEAGWGDCNRNRQRDGCETNTDTDANNCGMCGMPCPAISQTCVGGVC